MRKKSSTFISGIIAFAIYFLLLTLLVVYFNTRSEKKSIHYVKKNEERIRVSMQSPKKQETSNPEKNTKKKLSVKKPSVKKNTQREKKVIKEKVVKKKAPQKTTPKKNKSDKKVVKKVNKPKDLFDSIQTKKRTKKEHKKADKKKEVKQKTKSASELFSESLKKQKKSDAGIENAYLASIEEKLKGWPAQSDFAGERVKVSLLVEKDGSFTFNVRSASSNETFNTELIAYLEQLQRLGFGSHKGQRAYAIDVEFIAKE